MVNYIYFFIASCNYFVDFFLFLQYILIYRGKTGSGGENAKTGILLRLGNAFGQ